jgi:hypothetical protein
VVRPASQSPLPGIVPTPLPTLSGSWPQVRSRAWRTYTPLRGSMTLTRTVTIGCVCLALIVTAAPMAAAQRTLLPVPEPPAPVAPPPPLDINSAEFQQQLAREQAAALRKVSRSRRSNVTRTFAVGLEMHHGLFLIPAGAKDWQIVSPDFLDDGVLALFLNQTDQASLAGHVGQHRLICRCTGVPWSFHTEKRFLVRSATLEWQ